MKVTKDVPIWRASPYLYLLHSQATSRGMSFKAGLGLEEKEEAICPALPPFRVLCLMERTAQGLACLLLKTRLHLTPPHPASHPPGCFTISVTGGTRRRRVARAGRTKVWHHLFFC